MQNFALPSKCILVRMNHKVSAQFPFRCELLAADFAFLAVQSWKVKLFMTAQLFYALKAQVTKIAGKRSIGSVHKLNKWKFVGKTLKNILIKFT